VKLLLALLCEDASLNPDGRLDIHAVLNELSAPGFPARQDRMVLVVVLEWKPEDQGRFALRVDLLAPDGKPSVTVNGHTDVAPRPPGHPPARTQLVMPLELVTFPTPGPYRFRVRVKGQDMEGPTLHLMTTDR
jgi:hypothetical protein